MGYIEITATGTTDTETSTADYPHGVSGLVTAIRVDFTGAPNTTTVVVSAENDVVSSVTLLNLSAGNTSATYYPIVAPTITSAAPATPAYGVAVNHPYTATGTPAPTWSVMAGALPTGLSLHATTGVLSGMPTASGAW